MKLLAVAMSGLSFVVLPAFAGPIENLPGRWSGWGQMTLAGGSVEKLKCIATYRPSGQSGDLRHNLRCASASYNIDAAAKMKFSNGRVSGQWQERNYAASGAMSGKVSGSQILVSIAGDTFRASMTVSTTKCRQSMNIAPSGIDISNIAVKLAKC